MRVIVTIGGILVSIAFLLLIHGAITSTNIRQNETEISVNKAMFTAQKLLISGSYNPDRTRSGYQRSDKTTITMPYHEYSNFLIGVVKEGIMKYAVGFCYEEVTVEFAKESRITVKSCMDGGGSYFKVPLTDLENANFLVDTNVITFCEGDTILEMDSLLYTNRNIYIGEEVILEKNLLSDKDLYLLNQIITCVTNSTNSDSTVTVELIDIDYDRGSVDVCVTEEYSYLPTGSKGKTSKRQSFCFV